MRLLLYRSRGEGNNSRLQERDAEDGAATPSSRRLTKPRGELIFSPGSLPSREGSLFFGREAYQAGSEAYFFSRKLTKPRGELIFSPGSLPSHEGSLFFGQEAFQAAGETFFFPRKLTKAPREVNFLP